MDEATRQFIRRRAGERCEYCRLPQAALEERFSIDHIIPRKHQGDDDADNLALACLRCNLHKGTNLTGIDPDSHAIESLFNPRLDSWPDHFRWTGPLIAANTAKGRTTIQVLQMNAPLRVRLRQTLIAEGLLIAE